ncbi:MAG: hypothetical protein K8I60_00520 [Anaerolineae bacterium]|nr:hypothetical protein [Anaerolineae bacterium]
MNLDWVGNIIEDCRIYPSSRSIFDRRGDGLARILEALERKTLKSNVHSLFNLDGVPHSQTDRIFDALEWFNRSCYSEITTDVSLIYLAIAYETLLFPPRKAGFDDRNPKSINLYNSIRLVVGDLPRLEQWVEQFYNARSRIMHEGKSSKIRLVIQDKNTQSPPTVNEYGSLIHYGWLIFRICLNSVLTGLSNASAIDLQARFFSNKDRLEQIWKVLDQTTDPFDVITLITDDIRVLSNIEMRDNQSFKVELLLTIARLLAHRLMSLVDETEEQIALQKILVPRYHIQFDDEIEIVEYARLVFENISKDELPEKVIKLAIRDLSSDTPPSLQKIRQKIRGILKRNKNKLSDESQRRLKNVVALIECSFIRFQLISVIDIADSVSSLHISKHRPFSLMEGYAFFVKDNIDTMKSNTTLSMSLFKSHMEGQSDRSHLQ